MTHLDWIDAATLALPPHARLTDITRLQKLGLTDGPERPLHFVVQGDLHLDLPDVFLHRTEVLPATDAEGVTPASAFIAYVARARVIDAIKVGDWLLNLGHMSMLELRELAGRERWRPGAREALWVSRHLNAASCSLKESETRAILAFAGLPTPEVNGDISQACGQFLARGDVVFRAWRLLVEYEGRQHVQNAEQWNSDIDRYGRLRANHWRYVQVTNEKLAPPKSVVAEVYEALVHAGYDGPPPAFGRLWHALFAPTSLASLPRAVS